MSSTDYKVTSQAVLDRLQKSLTNKNSNDMEIVYAIYDNFDVLIGSIWDNFFLKIKSGISERMPDLKLNDQLDDKKYAGLSWRKNNWPAAIAVSFSFEASNYSQLIFGVSGLVQTSDNGDQPTISNDLHRLLAEEANKLDFTLRHPFVSSNYWPAYKFLGPDWNIRTYSGYEAVSGRTAINDETLVQITIREIADLVEMVDNTISKIEVNT